MGQHHQIRALDPDPVAANLPLSCFPAYQWKYDVDEGSPWWKKMYFRFVWMPIARFSYFKVKIIPFSRLEPDGSLSWKEEQGTFLREEDAEREAAKYPYGGYDEVLLDVPESAHSITGRSHFPASTAWLAYERDDQETSARDIVIASTRLREVLKDTDVLVKQFRSRRHA